MNGSFADVADRACASPMPTSPPMTPSASASTMTSVITRPPLKPERLQHGDLRAALANGHAHRVGA